MKKRDLITDRPLSKDEEATLKKLQEENPLYTCKCIIIKDKPHYIRNIGFVEYKNIMQEVNKKRLEQEAKLAELRRKYKDDEDNPDLYKEYAQIPPFQEADELINLFVKTGLLGPNNIISQFEAGALSPMVLMILYEEIFNISMLEDNDVEIEEE